MAKLCAKLFGLLLVVSLVQLTVIEPSRHASGVVEKLSRRLATNPDIVYFCDSTNVSVAATDLDRRAIAACLEDFVEGPKVCAIDGPAYHAGVYEAWVDLILRRKRHPQAVIIPINLRSLSPEWHLRPEYQFTSLTRKLHDADRPFYRAVSPLIERLGMLDQERISQAEFEQSPVYCGAERVGCVRDFDNVSYRNVTPEATRNKFIFHYMYELDREHERLAAFVRIARKLRAADIKAIFYITPIDVETGERVLPGRFRTQVAANIGVIRHELQQCQTPVFDLAFALPPQDFNWQCYPNEHLCASGRTFVADTLADMLQPLAADPSRGGPRALLASPISDSQPR